MLKPYAYGTYQFTDGTKRHVPQALVSMLAPGMYATLKKMEWNDYYCPWCQENWDDGHHPSCSLHLLLSTIDNWDQEKFSLSWEGFEALQGVLRKVEGE